MAEILLFHHALGLTDGVVAFADSLRGAGHRVDTPDLFDGARFAAVADGVAHAEAVGFDEIVRRGVAAADGADNGLMVIGFSLGVLPAQTLAQTRPGVAGAVLCHSAVPPSMLGGDWPAAVRLQMHFCEDDPWAEEDLPAARDLAAAVGGELCLYPGSGHLVADPTSPDHDPVIAAQILERVLAFVSI